MLFKNRNNVSVMIEEYLSKMYACSELFKETVNLYFKEGLSDGFKDMVKKTHKSESEADDIRLKIETDLYQKSLIPEARGDMLGLIESVDMIFNKAQSVLYQIETQSLEIPMELKEDFLKLVEINTDSFEIVIEGVRTLFKNIRNVKLCVTEIDGKESASDRMERAIIRNIFGSGYDIGQKILLKELILEAGKISDLSEEAGHRLAIIAAKRVV